MVWVECKVDAPALSTQGETYLDLFEPQYPYKERSFAWLLRAGAYVEGGWPESQVKTWQGLAEALDGTVDGDGSLKASWIVREFLDHLENEQRLVWLTPFSSRDADAIRDIHPAKARLHALVEGVAEEAKASRPWPDLPNDTSGSWLSPEAWTRDGDQRCFKFPLSADVRSEPPFWWLEFHLVKDDDRRAKPAGELTIAAGLAYSSEGAMSLPVDLVDRLEGAGFEYGEPGGRAWTVFMRYKDLGELAEFLGRSTSPADQVGALLEWCEAAFGKVEELIG